MAGLASLNWTAVPVAAARSPGRSAMRASWRISCQPGTSGDSAATEEVLDKNDLDHDKSIRASSATQGAEFPEVPNRGMNRKVALASTFAALGLFLSTRLDMGVSLKDLAANAVPYEEALSNGRPTVVEFYADWCEVCRELAPDIYKVEQQYKDRVNFVMLNVDNTKWEQELDEFGVEGIPHFAFLDKKGNEEGNIVGRLPKQYLLENVDALARGKESVPHARVVGQYSSAQSRKVHQVVDPRSHVGRKMSEESCSIGKDFRLNEEFGVVIIDTNKLQNQHVNELNMYMTVVVYKMHFSGNLNPGWKISRSKTTRLIRSIPLSPSSMIGEAKANLKG